MAESGDIATINEQKELQSLVLEMEAIRHQFAEASAVFVAQWLNETAKRYVCEDSQNTLRLGRERLSSMKCKLKNLTDNAERIVNEVFSDQSLWWHLAPKDEDENSSPYVQQGNNCPIIIDNPIRKALGKLGVILEENGYRVTTKAGGSAGNDVSVWNNKNVSPYPINPMPYYPNSFEWSKDMKDLMKRYNEIYRKAYDAYLDIKRLPQSRLHKQAAELWDSV